MELNPDGTVAINFGETKVRVKAPTIGQYRRLRETIHRGDEERRATVAQWRTEAGVPDPWPEDPTAEETAALNGVIRRSNQAIEDSLIDLWHLILVGEALGDTPFPSLALDSLPTVNVDEWPLELMTADTYNKAMGWWSGTPLSSGTGSAQ